MTGGSDGWWRIAREVPPGTRYRFRIDGRSPFPDPRSPWQPEGVHGPSATVDHGAFDWTDGDWNPPALRDAVIYELHIGTFTSEGTHRAAIGRLEFLRDLGVTHIELLPLAAFPGKHGWGYDGVCPFAPHPAYGTPDDLKALINAAHAHGIAVLLDVVYNHLGPDGNYLGQFGPYFTDRWKTPWGDAVNFDGPESDEVRAYFIDNALMWMRDYHFDGLRLDAVHAIVDTRAVHLLEELAERTRELSIFLNRRCVLIAESDLNDPRFVHPVSGGGYGLDAHWIDDFHHAIHARFTGERDGYYADFGSLATLAKALRQGYVFDGCYCSFRRRTFGRPPIGVPNDRFVAFAQNHDQTGNRGRGERLAHLGDPDAIKAVSALVLLSPFVPMLFQGEEWGASSPFLYFTDHVDHHLARAVSQGRRNEFAKFDWGRGETPDPQDPETFLASKLKWSEISSPKHADLLDWHRRLIEIRKSHPSDPLAQPKVEFDEAANWLTLRHGTVTLACNFASTPQAVPVPGATKVLLSSNRGVRSPGDLFPAGATVVFSH